MSSFEILEILTNHHQITSVECKKINEVLDPDEDAISFLTTRGIVDEDTLYRLIAKDFGVPYLDLKCFNPPEKLVRIIPKGTALLYGALPVNLTPAGIHVAITNPFNPSIMDDLRFALGRDICLVIAKREDILRKLEDCYSMHEEEVWEVSSPQKPSPQSIKVDAPIIRYVNMMITQAVNEGASDIHFEPFENDYQIRMRVDGALYELAPPPVHLGASINSRIKVMANMNISENRIPQDGRIVHQTGMHHVNIRVSSIPTRDGESLVLRILDQDATQLHLHQLGLPRNVLESMETTIHKPNGIFLTTGPTGAGKTTTLYACLHHINNTHNKLVTAEDPVEYDIDGITQVSVNDRIGLSFSKLLRAFLRQDPDHILIGEIRDLETAQIAIQASLTGHLVFSTLHTNDASGAITRLLDMGCEPFLLSATLEAVLGQRLVRRICTQCKTPFHPSERDLSGLSLTPDELNGQPFHLGAGCSECQQLGYKGRLGIFEYLELSDPIRQLISESTPSVVLREKALKTGMTSLREDGLRHIYEGNTTIEEVVKYT